MEGVGGDITLAGSMLMSGVLLRWDAMQCIMNQGQKR
jgi:hypothetical protein